MDFSALNDTLASKSYNQITDICDTLIIQAIQYPGVVFQDEWPYAIHILGHIYINGIVVEFDVNSDDATKNRVRIISSLTTNDEHERDLPVPKQRRRELYTERMFELLVSAYSTISTQDTALFPGLNVDDAANYALERGWTLDHASQMLTVKKQVVATEQKLDSSKLQRLTEYVFHLEH